MFASRHSTAALLIPFSVILLTLSAAQRTDDPPKASPKPPELQLLHRWVGTWDGEFTDLRTQEVGKSTSRWEMVLDGRFLQGKLESPRRETLVMMTYDPEDRVYRVWSFSSTGRSGHGTGRWDEKSMTMTWDGKGRGVEGPETSILIEHWLDEDTREVNNTIKDAEGKVIADIKVKVRRSGRVGLVPVHKAGAERN